MIRTIHFSGNKINCYYHEFGLDLGLRFFSFFFSSWVPVLSPSQSPPCLPSILQDFPHSNYLVIKKYAGFYLHINLIADHTEKELGC